MKNFYLRSCIAIACAFGLASCGGSNDSLVLQIQVLGLTKEGLSISNNGGTPVLVHPTDSYVLYNNYGTDTNFDLKIATPVSNAVCTIENGTGKTGSYSPVGIRIICIAYTFNLGGKIKGLAGDGLILSNGAVRKTFNHTNPVSDFDFNMTTLGTTTGNVVVPDIGKVAEDSPYGVLIYQQPTTGTCVIDKRSDGTSTGVGVMPAGDLVGTAPEVPAVPPVRFDPITVTCT